MIAKWLIPYKIFLWFFTWKLYLPWVPNIWMQQGRQRYAQSQNMFRRGPHVLWLASALHSQSLHKYMIKCARSLYSTAMKFSYFTNYRSYSDRWLKIRNWLSTVSLIVYFVYSNHSINREVEGFVQDHILPSKESVPTRSLDDHWMLLTAH